MRYRVKDKNIRQLSLGAKVVDVDDSGYLPSNAPQGFIRYWLARGVIEPVQSRRPRKPVEQPESPQKED